MYSKWLEKRYDNLVMYCPVENQKNTAYKLSVFKDLPIKYKCITVQSLLENIDIKNILII